MSSILSAVSHFIILTISSLSYGGVAFLMGVAAFNIPIPSEVIMPFSGYLASTGRFNLILVAVCGALGWLIGGIASYFLGKFGGRLLVEKYGKYIFISKYDIDRSERWFQRYGEATIFLGQIIPVVRNFISLPSGIARLNFKKFVIYTFLGAFLWSYFLSWVGFKLGANWPLLKAYFSKLDWLVIILIFAAVILWLWRHLKKR